MRNISNLLYFSCYSKLGEISGRLYSMHCARLDEKPELYRPFTLNAGALLRLASYACDALSDQAVVERVNLDRDVVEIIKFDVLNIITSLIKVYNSVIDMRIHPEQTNDLVFSAKLLLHEVKNTLNRMRCLCQKLIKYSNVIARDDFLHMSLAVHNLDFFSYNIQEYVDDIKSAISEPCRSMSMASVPATERAKISSENFNILEPLDFNKNRYLCDLKDKAISELVPVYDESLTDLGLRYGYDISLLFKSVMISTQEYRQPFSKGSRLVILSCGRVACINDLKDGFILYNKFIVSLAEGGVVYSTSSNIGLRELSGCDQEAQGRVYSPDSVLSSSDEELITSLGSADKNK
ncbi:hypothetical protein [Ehrlichia chaffeensis]|uniref:hypothetical protein n=1 Tax=Ehrlichia chaffeensis TaxID=945 RepID=UPI000444E30E|nr:hypothetical protein [Ehrlichia chaffeensis]AHX05888.1 hypothetical protein ECHJAX_0832 [Ehrlichia chaffeensis str. Jax]